MIRGRTAVAALGLLVLHAGSLAAEQALDTARRLYRDFAWEAVLSDPGQTSFVDQPRTRLLAYLTPALADSLLRDRRCAAQRREICALEFAPLWDSQDPVAMNLELRQETQVGRVRVSFRSPGTDARQVLHLLLKRSDGRWRVDDIEYAQGPSLRRLLERTR